MQRLLNFDVVVEPLGEGYRTRVVSSPVGEAEANFALPFTDKDLEIFVLKVVGSVGRVRRKVRRIDSLERRLLEDFGDRLFQAAFSGGVRECLVRSRLAAESKGAGLRIRLRLPPALANIPWEFLYDAEYGFLGLSPEIALLRYAEMPTPVRPFPISPPLRILAMLSAPSDVPGLQGEEEWGKLNDALDGLANRGMVLVDRLQAGTLSALQRPLRLHQYHVLHFVGHGGFDEDAQDGALALEGADRKARLVTGRDLGLMIRGHRSLRLVVLNACEGARSARDDPFGGVAQALVRQGVPAVIAMQFEISDPAAVVFSQAFYQAIADGLPVDLATVEARRAMFAEGSEVEWATPVLYLRSPDGRVFTRGKVAEPERQARQEPERQARQEPERQADIPRADPPRTLLNASRAVGLRKRRVRRMKVIAGATLLFAAVTAGSVLLTMGGHRSAHGATGVKRTKSALAWQRVSGGALAGPGSQEITSSMSLGGSRYVAGGVVATAGATDAAIWTTSDGRTWKRAIDGDLSGRGNQKINTVAMLGGVLLAAGSDGVGGDLDAAFWESRDGGANWTRILQDELREPGDQTINRLRNAKQGLWAAGSETINGNVDAAVWLYRAGAPSIERLKDADFTGPGSQVLWRVVPFGVSSGSLLVAVGYDTASGDGDGAVWTSSDGGQSWERVSDPGLGGGGYQQIFDAGVSGTRLIAVGCERKNGNTDAAIWSSRDGRAWERVADPTGALGGPGDQVMVRFLPIGGDLREQGVPTFIAGGSDKGRAGSDAAIWTSKDGKTWTRDPDPDAVLGGQGDQSIASLAAGAQMIAVGRREQDGNSEAEVWLGSPVKGARP